MALEDDIERAMDRVRDRQLREYLDSQDDDLPYKHDYRNDDDYGDYLYDKMRDERED